MQCTTHGSKCQHPEYLMCQSSLYGLAIDRDSIIGLARTYPHFFTKTVFFHFWPQNRFEVKKKEFEISFFILLSHFYVMAI